MRTFVNGLASGADPPRLAEGMDGNFARARRRGDHHRLSREERRGLSVGDLFHLRKGCMAFRFT